MTSNIFKDTKEADAEEEYTSTLRIIGQGFCGTVWASEKGPAFKREDGGPDRSLINDFQMHHQVIQSFQKIPILQFKIKIPACYNFIKATDQKWWSINHRKFPPGYTPCNMIQSQRIPPFSDPIRGLLIRNYYPPKIVQEIIASDPNKDCLVRPYLGRRRTQTPYTTSQFTAFSLRNFPLHIDQLEEIGITTSDINQYARVMAETLAIMHWVGEVDGNDIEFVLAPPPEDSPGLNIESNALGAHSMWILDFDLCRRMAMDSHGVEQAAAAFWGNDHYYPRSGFGRDLSLWTVFREYYLRITETSIGIVNEPHEAERRRALSRQFIDLVEQEGNTRKENEKKFDPD